MKGWALKWNERCGSLKEDVHPLVPQNTFFKVGEARVGYESEDLLIHGDNLSRVCEYPIPVRGK